MKGIILAGGSGTRLHPITLGVSKQLIPVYDKPMVYYPLSTLMLAGIREILMITTPHEQDGFKRLLGDGSQFGIRLAWATQPKPEGLAQAFLIGREFVGSDGAALALGDNIFYWQRPAADPAARGRAHDGRDGLRLPRARPSALRRRRVRPWRQGDRPRGEAEKPRSHHAVTGLYFYDNRVLDIAAKLKPSARGELEITDVNRAYLQTGELHVEVLGRGMAWLDTGTHEALLQASTFIQAIEERQDLKVACPEEVALNMGFVSAADVRRLAEGLKKSEYGQYLLRLVDEA
jgi:glucose-1-phosphate thymidylyltransferase